MDSICEHLGNYALSYKRAAANYQVCLDLVERVMAKNPDPSLPGTLERALNDWEMETRRLREMFVTLVNRKAIKLPTADGRPVPAGEGGGECVCAVCGAEVPRLVFREWSVDEEGGAQFKGQALFTPEPEPQPV